VPQQALDWGLATGTGARHSLQHRLYTGNPCTLQTKDANSPPEAKEEREAVDFTGPVDSVYLDAPGYVELDVGTGACDTDQGM
jgi:hypothetical protein